MPFLLPDQEPFRHKKLKSRKKQEKTAKNDKEGEKKKRDVGKIREQE